MEIKEKGGRVCWEQGKKLEKKDVWKFIKRKRERLKTVHIKVTRRQMNSLEGSG